MILFAHLAAALMLFAALRSIRLGLYGAAFVFALLLCILLPYLGAFRALVRALAEGQGMTCW